MEEQRGQLYLAADVNGLIKKKIRRRRRKKKKNPKPKKMTGSFL